MPDLRAQAFSVAHVTGEKRPVVFLHVAEAEIERLREALRQIADGEVRPQPDESGWFSVANGVRMLARGAIAPLSDQQATPDEPGKGRSA